MNDYLTEDRSLLYGEGKPIDRLDQIWGSEDEFVTFYKSRGFKKVPAGTRIRIFSEGKYTEKYWDGEAWKEVAAESEAVKTANKKAEDAAAAAARISAELAEARTSITDAKDVAADALKIAKDLESSNAGNAYNAAMQAQTTASSAGTAAATANSNALLAQTLANTAINASAEAKGTAAEALREAKANTETLKDLKPITSETFGVVPNSNGMDIKARGQVLFNIPEVDAVDAGLMTPAMLKTLKMLVGLDGTRFGGFSINDDPEQAVEHIAILFDDYGLTAGEAYWFLAGRGIESLRAYRYDGNGGEPELISDNAYDLTDFTEAKSDIKKIQERLDRDVDISESEYQRLVDDGQVDRNKHYYIYEE